MVACTQTVYNKCCPVSDDTGLGRPRDGPPVGRDEVVSGSSDGCRGAHHVPSLKLFRPRQGKVSAVSE